MSNDRGSLGDVTFNRETERFLIQMMMIVWKSLVRLLGVGNLSAGLVLALGPARYRAAPNYGIFDQLHLPGQTYPVALVLSGLMIVVSLFLNNVWFSVSGHSLAFVVMFWWGFVAIGFLLDGQSSSGGAAFYILMLAGTHLCIVVAKVRAWYILNGGKNG